MVFNKLNLNFNKEKKKKARVKRKAMKLQEKHKIAKQNQSGKRTKKALRKQAHKERAADTVAETFGDEQMAEVAKSSSKRKNPKKKGAAKKAAAAAAGDEMQD